MTRISDKFLGWTERLTGSVLGKEMRVASRRRRLYLLRFLYLAGLTVVVGLYWDSLVGRADRHGLLARGSAQIAFMSDLGREITGVVLIFQAAVCMSLGAILLAGSICGEYVSGTMWALMSTPLSAGQLVLGKLLGGLWQVLMLLALGLPMLAVVRVFGGVEWEMLGAAYAMTLSGTVLVASFSLWVSASARSAVGAMVKVVVLGVAFQLGEYILARTCLLGVPHAVMATPSPLLTLVGLVELVDQRVWPQTATGFVVTHCASLLLTSLIFLALAARRVRNYLPQMLNTCNTVGGALAPRAASKPTITVGLKMGSRAVLWKDLRLFLPNDRPKVVMALMLGLLALMVMYSLGAQTGYGEAAFHFMILGLCLPGTWLMIACLAATSLTVEKQTRALPILLTAPLDDWEIIGHKALATAGRSGVLWAWFVLHVGLFAAMGYLKAGPALKLVMLLAGVSLFLYGLGTCVSARCRRSSTAVAITLGLAVLTMIVLPMLPVRIHGFHALSPFVQFADLVYDAVRETASRYHGWQRPEPTGYSMAVSLLAGVTGGLLLLDGKIQMRRKVFG